MNDEVRLFDGGKKLAFSDCPDTSLDEIGSDLLSHDFLKDDNGMSRSGDPSGFSDPLLIINNELSSQRQISLDDLDLSSLSTLENNGVSSQHPQESLGFGDFLSGTSFCLDKLSEPDKQLSFGSFSELTGETILSKEYKIVPAYVDGKLSSVLHLDDVGGHGKIYPPIASTSSGLTIPTTSSTEKITATIEDFPSVSVVTGNTLTLNGQVQAVPGDDEPDISDLIRVKPREPKKTKKRTVKTPLSCLKKKKQKKLDRSNQAASEKSSNKKNTTADTVKKKSTSVAPQAAAEAPKLKSSESKPKNGIPKFKIIQQTEQPTSSESAGTVATNKFSNGLSTASESASAPPPAPLLTITTSRPSNQPQSVELILPVISVRDESSSKTVLKPISDLRPGDVPVGNQGLSQDQKQQIAVILKQREARKRATGSSSNGPKRNENKIICRVLFPKDFESAAKDDSTVKNAEAEDRRSVEDSPKAKKLKTITRPRQPHMNEDFEAEIPLATSVTRSGRTSRPPKKLIKRDSKSPVSNEKKDEPVQTSTVSATTSAEGADVAKPKPELLDGIPDKKKSSKKNANYVCQTCNRRYIEVKKFKLHLEAFPNHVGNPIAPETGEETLNPPNPTVPPAVTPSVNPTSTTVRPKRRCRCKCRSHEKCRARSLTFKKMVDTISEREFLAACGPRFVKTTSVWDFLLLRIKAVYKYEDFVKGVLSELGKLWESLKAVSSKILFPSDHPSETTVTIEDNATCEALGVSKGVYQTFPSGLDITTPSAEHQDEPEPGGQTAPAVPPPDTSQDISQSSLLSDILCDKSGMDTVDQLVNERLKTLAPGDDMLDPPSDDLMTSILNSVHSNSLTDSMFNPLVSGSSEDLLKALENFSNPPPLDFTALTNDYPDR